MMERPLLPVEVMAISISSIADARLSQHSRHVEAGGSLEEHRGRVEIRYPVAQYRGGLEGRRWQRERGGLSIFSFGF